MHRSRLRYRLERIGLAIGIVLAIVIIIAVINMVLESDQGPLEPTPEVTAEPTLVPATPATPATPERVFDPEPEPDPGSLLHMLGYAPDRLRDDSLPLSDIAQYANVLEWMETQGVDLPSGPEDPNWTAWQQQLPALAIPEVLAARGTDDVWINTYGFGLHQVHQVLAVGSPPDYVMVMRGDFDEDTLLAAWADSGYQAVSMDGITYWSLYPGGSVDLSAPASRPALGNMNNVVLLEDGTLIATSRADRMEQTVRDILGASPTLAENDDIRGLLSSGIEPENLVTATLLKGTVLEEPYVPPPGGDIATPTVDLPRAELLITGLHIQPESDRRVTMVIVSVYDSATEATEAQMRASDLLRNEESRITGAPYTDRVQPLSMRVVSSGDGRQLLLLHLTLLNGPADWLQIVEDRDLGYLMWPRIP